MSRSTRTIGPILAAVIASVVTALGVTFLTRDPAPASAAVTHQAGASNRALVQRVARLNRQVQLLRVQVGLAKFQSAPAAGQPVFVAPRSFGTASAR